jgi:DNA sulfur modification protein DndD
VILKNLSINNIGTYSGTQVFDLSPRMKYRSSRPIILIGGKNGAGKTTLLEAIDLCLYGKGAIASRISQKDYEDVILDKIHSNNNAIVENKNASIILDFQHAHAGITDNYKISRSWKKNTKTLKETLHIERNGMLLSDLDQDQWSSFVKELIPPGLAQLFFFDAERIRKLSGDDFQDNPFFAESVESLLGLDVVDKLYKDLSVYAKRINIPKGFEAFAKEKVAIEDEIETLGINLKEERQDRSQIESKIKWIKSNILKHEQDIAASGGEFFVKYDELKITKTKLLVKKDQIKISIQSLAQELFPFGICKNLAKKLINRINDEVSQQNIENSTNSVKDHVSKVKDQLRLKLKKKFSNSEIDWVLKELKNASNISLSAEIHNLGFYMIKDLSNSEIDNIKGWIQQSTNEIPEKMAKLCNDLDDIEHEINITDNNLSRTPSEELLEPLFLKLNKLNKDVGALEEKAKLLDTKITHIENEKEKLEQKLKKINQELSDSDKIEDRFKTTANIQTVLVEFSEKVKKSKIKELEQTISRLFMKLSRKKDLISKIKIDPTNYKISILDNQNHKISSNRLSSGEKQIFAISILWALRKISGRPIPVIIDTPLARLDSEHRNNLVNTYFPEASHQTILLSTDTEIDKGYFKKLSKFISHSYHLNFSSEDSQTSVEEGYFFKK